MNDLKELNVKTIIDNSHKRAKIIADEILKEDEVVQNLIIKRILTIISQDRTSRISKLKNELNIAEYISKLKVIRINV